MRLYADCPPAFSDIVSEAASWSRCHRHQLPGVDQDLCEALGAQDELWLTELASGPVPSFWSRVVVIAEAPGSQFDVLRQLQQRRVQWPGPVACLALTGHDHHGQRGRPWAVVQGNLHLSVALPAGGPVAQLVPALTMLPAAAVVAAVSESTAGALLPGIKWVNDIVVGEHKIAGVIAATQTQGATVQSAVLGMGVNVAEVPDVAPTPSVPSVGSVAQFAPRAAPRLASVFWPLLAALASRFEQLLRRGPADLLAEYRRHSVVVGRQVRIYADTPSPGEAGDRGGASPELLAAGTVERIEPDLSLALRGRAEPVSKGRLVFEEVAQRFGL